MTTSPTSKSALVSGAAKDDAVGQGGDITFTISDLLANDPGGANKLAGHFFFGDNGVGGVGAHDLAAQQAYLDDHHILYNAEFTEFTLTSDSTDFNYMVQIGNKGTWSLAHVEVTAPPAPEPICDPVNIVTNSNFAGTEVTGSQGWSIAPIDGWNQLGGTQNEIEIWDQNGLNGMTSGLTVPAGDHVIETDGWGVGNASPIDGAVLDRITTNVDAVTGQEYHLTFDFASRADSGGILSDTDSFGVYWNGVQVGSFDPNSSDHWSHASIDVIGKAGMDVLEIREAGANDAYGAVISNVQVAACCDDEHAGAELFVENFDHQTNVEYFDPPGNLVFGTANLGDASGWTGPDAGYVELGANGYGGIEATSFGANGAGFWLDTQKSPGQVDISHTFIDPTGEKALVSFDVAVQNLDYLGQHYETDPDAKLDFKIDGNTIKSVSWAEVHDAVGDNNMLHFDVVADTGAAGQHTFSIVDASPDADYTGFAVDTIAIHDWVLC